MLLLSPPYPPSGETQALRLEGRGNLFERGKTDVFPVSAKDVGELQKLKIWHDNKGMGSAWALEMVVVYTK